MRPRLLRDSRNFQISEKIKRRRRVWVELEDFSKFRLNKGNCGPKCHHLSITAIKKLVICNRVVTQAVNITDEIKSVLVDSQLLPKVFLWYSWVVIVYLKPGFGWAGNAPLIGRYVLSP